MGSNIRFGSHYRALAILSMSASIFKPEKGSMTDARQTVVDAGLASVALVGQPGRDSGNGADARCSRCRRSADLSRKR